MTNHEIDAFFTQFGLTSRVEKQVRPPNVFWTLRAAGYPVMIQTQDNANRLRIVAFIAAASALDARRMSELLTANYHSALDARYAVADDTIVSAYLHPLRELTREQFILGFYQVVSCAETYGKEFSGGTLSFGPFPAGGNGASRPQGAAEAGTDYFTAALVNKIGE